MRMISCRWAILLPGLVIFLSLIGIGGLHGIRGLESYDPFCTSCHLQDHKGYLDDGRAVKEKIRTLGGWHLASGEAKCISCHGEDGVFGMFNTTSLAAGDAWRFVTGDYEQPSRVFHPIADKDCLKCHPIDRTIELETEDFHAILDHAELEFACIQCHNGHRTGGKRARRFIVPSAAQPRCDSCHKDLKQKVRVGLVIPPPNNSTNTLAATVPALPERKGNLARADFPVGGVRSSP